MLICGLKRRGLLQFEPLRELIQLLGKKNKVMGCWKESVMESPGDEDFLKGRSMGGGRLQSVVQLMTKGEDDKFQG